MSVVVDATTLVALGGLGELDRLRTLDGPLVTTPCVREEVTAEPAATNLDRLVERGRLSPATPEDRWCRRARDVLGDDDRNGDVEIVAHVLARTSSGSTVGVVSDDRRVRTTAGGLGATVTGTLGVVVRSVEAGRDPDDAKALLRRLDEQGLHMTAGLRERADELVEEAAER